MFKKEIKNLFKTRLWLFPLSFILYFFLDQIVDVFYGIRVFHILILGVLLACPLLFVWALIISIRKKTLVPWPAVITAFLVTYCWFQIREHVHDTLELKKVLMRPQEFSACIKNASPIPGGGLIGICEHTPEYAIGTELGINTEYITEAIIYDSTDQIAKEPSQRSRAWKHKAYSLRLEVPFGINGYEATKLIGHFYYVWFTSYQGEKGRFSDK